MKDEKKQKPVKCPRCGSRGEVIRSTRGKNFHACCHNPKCDLYTGYAEEKKIKWFDSEGEAIQYWNDKAKEENA